MSFQEELKLNIGGNMNIKQKVVLEKKPKPEMPIIGVQSLSLMFLVCFRIFRFAMCINKLKHPIFCLNMSN